MIGGKDEAGRLKIAVLLIILMAAPPLLSLQPASAASWNYSEKLDIFALGGLGFWRLQMDGGNVTLPALEGGEATASVDSYTLFAANSEKWSPSYALFSKAGFGIFDFEPIPVDGVFLVVEAEDRGDALRFAAALGSALDAGFVEYPADKTGYTFYSHTDFSYIVERHLWAAVPEGLGGFAKLIDRASYLRDGLPLYILRGSRTGESFAHTLTLAGVKQDIIKQDELKFLSVFPRASAAEASTLSNSTTLQMAIVGGLVAQSEGVSFENQFEGYRAVMSLPLAPGEPLPHFNATIVDKVPVLAATRDVDVGAPFKGETAEVRVAIRNLSPEGAPPAIDVKVDEAWWQPYFEMVGGTPVQTIKEIPSGGSADIAYQIRVVDAQPREVLQTPEQNKILYSFQIGNETAHAATYLNPVRIFLNGLRPAVAAKASVEKASPTAGSLASTLIVNNTGARTAFNLKAYLDGVLVGESRELPPGRRGWEVRGEAAPPPRDAVGKTISWRVEWTEDDELRSVESNTINMLFLPSTPLIPHLRVEKSVDVKDVSGRRFGNVTLSVHNTGLRDAEEASLRDLLPPGTRYVNGSLTEAGGRLSSELGRLQKDEKRVMSYLIEFLASDENYVVPPATGSFTWMGERLDRLSASTTLPLGVDFSRTVSLTSGFVGSRVDFSVRATNLGALPIYDVEVAVEEEAFLETLEGNASKTVEVLGEGDAAALQYAARFTEAGVFEASGATLSFRLSGQRHELSTPRTTVMVSEPLEVKLAGEPLGPVEGKPFTVTLTVFNPSNMTVTNVSVRTTLPRGLRLLDGGLDVEGEELPGEQTLIRRATLVSERALTIIIKKPSVSYTHTNQTLRGRSSDLAINVADDVPMRYVLPIGLAVAIALASVYAAKRIASPPTRIGSSAHQPSKALRF